MEFLTGYFSSSLLIDLEPPNFRCTSLNDFSKTLLIDFRIAVSKNWIDSKVFLKDFAYRF